MVRWGFNVCRYNPCMYYHPARGLRCLVHGDDVVCVGDADDLKWPEKCLKEWFEIKSKTMGLREGESREKGFSTGLSASVKTVGNTKRTNATPISS